MSIKKRVPVTSGILQAVEETDSVFMNQLPAFPGVRERLEYWKWLRHKLVIITARAEVLRAGTEFMIQALFPKLISAVRLVGRGRPKKELLVQEKVSVWVDDAPHGVLEARSLGLRTFLVRNDNTLYNHSLDAEKEGIEVVASLERVFLAEEHA